MIKEFILASALTLTPNNYIQNVEYNAFRFALNFYDLDYQNYSGFFINLNNGSTMLVDYAFNEDNGLYFTDTIEWSNCGTYEVQDYLSYICQHSFDNVNKYTFDINMYTSLCDITTSLEDSYEYYWRMPIGFYIPGEDDSTYQLVSNGGSIQFGRNGENCYLNLGAQGVSSDFFLLDKGYLFIAFDDWEGSANIDYLTFLNSYNVYYDLELYEPLTESYSEGDYIGFVYSKLWNRYEEYERLNDELQDENEQLISENDELEIINQDLIKENDELEIINQDLIKENDELEIINQELRQENETLTSKHALSSVFEIVRGAIDGVINFLEIELMPNLTIGTIIFIPVVIGVIFFILKALVL